MHALQELSLAVRVRRFDMGLTQTALAKFSGLSRATVNQVETGVIKDLSLTRTAKLLGVLGLVITVSPAHPKTSSTDFKKTPALEIAARTASVSYKEKLTAEQLHEALLHGNIPSGRRPQVNTLLEEASVSLLANVVEQLNEESGIERAQIWSRMRDLSRQMKGTRDIWR